MFTGMADWDQWIVWEIQERNGKQTKVPIGPTRVPIDSQNSANWRSYAQACEVAKGLGAGVGFVFTEADPFFFVDVDHALVDGVWSDTARWVRSVFGDCAYEVSYSGDGFHLFGTYSAIVPHSNKRKDLGLEFYTAGRFVACTFREFEPGDGLDRTTPANEFAAHFPPKPKADPVEWTSGPDPEWSGPADDADLLAKFFAQKPTPAQAFQGVPTNRQLWDGEVDQDQRSESDLSLAGRLAFWTGKDAARIERMMSEAPLCDRDKWRDRPDYRERTISTAVASCENVYQDRQVADPVDPVNALTVDAIASPPDVGWYPADLQREKFAGCVYVSDVNRIWTPDGFMYSEKQFRSMYGGHTFALDFEHGKTSNAWEAFVESRVNTPARAHSSTFRPRLAPGALFRDGGQILVNSYVPATVESAPGDVSPLLDLMQRVYPDPRDQSIILSYAAFIVQNPGVKSQWALVLQGPEGNGKSFLARCIAYAVSERYSHFPNAQDIGNKFNAWITNRLFICVEEIKQAGREDITETLKPMITNSRIEVQAKGSNQVTGDNCANFLFNTNYKDAVHKTVDDRRYCVIYGAQQSKAELERDGMGGRYFPDLWDWFNQGGNAHVAHWLQTCAIADEFNPAKGCHRAPETSSTGEAVAVSRPEVEQRIQEAIAEGVVGFRGGWVSSVALSILFERERVGHKARKAAVLGLGFEPHPGLHEGRATSALRNDGNRKPTLYVRPGSIQAGLAGSAVGDAYSKAQDKLDATEPAWTANQGETNG